MRWSRPVRGGITVQPDLQYVFSPAGRRDLRDALVLGSRLILSVGG